MYAVGMTLPVSVELGIEQLEALSPFPLTKKFFETNPPKETEPVTGGIQNISKEPVELEIESKIGTNWRNIAAIVIVASRIQDIIRMGANMEETKQKINGTATTLFLIGYELGWENLKPDMTNAIADHLKHKGTFNSQLNNSGEGIQEYRKICLGILAAGALAKKEPLVSTGT